MIPEIEPKLPVRCRRYGVGKEIGGAVYVHRRYASVFGDAAFTAASHLQPAFEYAVVKYRPDTGAITFVECPGFDSEPEPAIGRTCLVRTDGSILLRQARVDPYIYHHKWLFVTADYDGFNVDVSHRRSAQWMRLSDIDYSRIGRQCYWMTNIVPRIGQTAASMAEPTSTTKAATAKNAPSTTTP